MTFLPTQVEGQWFYLYLILDLTAGRSSASRSTQTTAPITPVHLAEIALRWWKACTACAIKPVCCTVTTVQIAEGHHRPRYALLVLASSHPTSRPRVSDDNAFAEALFRTAKYHCLQLLVKGFADLDAARQWVACFVRWA